jgi:hypothetical protein
VNHAQIAERVTEAARLAEPYCPAGIGWDSQWRTRGRSRHGNPVRGLIEHTSEDVRPLPWSTLYPLIRDGHGVLAGNILYNSAIRRDGRVVILGVGTAWHAGTGAWQQLAGNVDTWGNCYQRGGNEILTDTQLAAGQAWTWALTQTFGFPTVRVCEHHEWASGRKNDRQAKPGVRMSGAVWRRQIAAGPASRDTITVGDAGPDVADWQGMLNRLYPHHRHSGPPSGRFDVGTVERTLLVLRGTNLEPADPSRPRVGPATRKAAAKLAAEPWAGKRVRVRTDGLRWYTTPGWHPSVPAGGTSPKGAVWQGGIVRQLTVDGGVQYEVMTRGSGLIRYVTGSPVHIELVD